MAQAARSSHGRVGELVAALQGWEFPKSDIELEEISLRSPAEAWPPRIRIAAHLMTAIVSTHLMDLTAPP